MLYLCSNKNKNKINDLINGIKVFVKNVPKGAVQIYNILNLCSTIISWLIQFCIAFVSVVVLLL